MRTRGSLQIKAKLIKLHAAMAAVFLVAGLLPAALAADTPCSDFLDPHFFAEYSFQDLSRPYKYFADTEPYVLSGERLDSIRDQCRYGSCWAHASLSLLESRARKHGVDIRLSEEFLIRAHLLEQAWVALNHKSRRETFPRVDQGEQIEDGVHLAITYGVVPQSAWSSRIDIAKDREVGNRLILHLNALIAHLRHSRMPTETSWGVQYVMSTPEKARESWEMILDFIDSYFGPPPKKFLFQNASYGPVKFAKHPMFKMLFSEGFESIRVKEDPLAAYKAVKAQLLATGEPVRLSTMWTDVFVDHDSGIMSLDAFNPFNSNPEFLVLLAEGISKSASHAVNIVDFSEDSDGNPVKFLVLNSHGKDHGDRGYYHIYWDYFQHMATKVRVYKRFLEKR